MTSDCAASIGWDDTVVFGNRTKRVLSAIGHCSEKDYYVDSCEPEDLALFVPEAFCCCASATVRMPVRRKADSGHTMPK